jgi:hypothetical protein
MLSLDRFMWVVVMALLSYTSVKIAMGGIDKVNETRVKRMIGETILDGASLDAIDIGKTKSSFYVLDFDSVSGEITGQTVLSEEFSDADTFQDAVGAFVQKIGTPSLRKISDGYHETGYGISTLWGEKFIVVVHGRRPRPDGSASPSTTTSGSGTTERCVVVPF